MEKTLVPFLTLFTVHLSDLKARMELIQRTQAVIVSRLEGSRLDDVLATLGSEYDAAKKLHEASMLKDLEDLFAGKPWPPSDQKN